ncbi:MULTISPECIES: hypothetical protein [Mesorhizobium]|uniref:hypothetical protein n=1 Tax=Mesorhizobium TaxID=68287 RepID=UPI0007A95BF1|nr:MULTISPECIES: hypothetical protein [Mesorhizobium]AMX93748.1 hypothetical protein A4R28_11850 [Mesorhizobium ciceri]MDF3208449.1 hypothetical protein [Mesorhizobium sp. LMG15046]MDF3228980.1 hypothetical protein [Mesorhizobium sp. DSM 30133]RUU22099.1 hypothetical protein EOC84_03035 [Mesorhizobium sp. Primo-B]RUU37991.1 hypothetical protein EOC83_17180 [Mesorhizobium sp. Primo-A]
MSKKVTKADLELRVATINDEKRLLQQKAATSEATMKVALQERDRQSSAVADLKTELMTKSLEVARLEGYITRANESDPLPVQPVYRTFGRVEQPSSVVNSYGSTWSEPQTPWWNR